ncbi:MAG: hypothetical protein IPL08_13845 [Saprospiraceae bacterium]|nr:hypothetical protein [Saprospiraceae bacterium]
MNSDKLIGNFNAFASVRNEVTDSAVTEFIYEMERIVTEPVSSDDLSLAKSSMTGNFGRSLESPQTIANFALNTFRYNLQKIITITISEPRRCHHNRYSADGQKLYKT